MRYWDANIRNSREASDATPTATARPARSSLDRLTRRFGGNQPAVDDVSLEIAAGELLALVGASRLGEDDDAAHGRRLRDAGRRARARSTATRHHRARRRSGAASGWCSSTTRSSRT